MKSIDTTNKQREDVSFIYKELKSKEKEQIDDGYNNKNNMYAFCSINGF